MTGLPAVVRTFDEFPDLPDDTALRAVNGAVFQVHVRPDKTWEMYAGSDNLDPAAWPEDRLFPATVLAPVIEADDATVERVARAMQADDVAHRYYAAAWGDYPQTDAAYLRNAATAIKAVTQ